MEIILRPEKESEYRIVEELTREAFWNHHTPGCNEHYLVHIMRDSDSFIKELDYVAVVDDKIVGNIMYTKAIMLGDDQVKHPVLCFGPISVLPAYQAKGIGRKLITHTRELAKALGYTAIIIYGDPAFYERVGFIPAESFSIGTAENSYAVALLACELVPGALKNCKGRFFEDEIYTIDSERAEAFDKTFPPKIKESGLPSQARFSQLVSMHKERGSL